MLEKPILENPILDKQPQLNTKVNKELNIYREVVEEYNGICTRLAKAERLTGARRRHIQARLSEYSKEDLALLFHKVNESDFLCGGNNGGWKADFDWLMKNTDNLLKVKEGKYDNKKTKTEQELIDAFNQIGGSNEYRPCSY